MKRGWEGHSLGRAPLLLNWTQRPQPGVHLTPHTSACQHFRHLSVPLTQSLMPSGCSKNTYGPTPLTDHVTSPPLASVSSGEHIFKDPLQLGL